MQHIFIRNLKPAQQTSIVRVYKAELIWSLQYGETNRLFGMAAIHAGFTQLQ